MKILKGLNESIKELDGTDVKADGESLVIKRIIGSNVSQSTNGDPIRMLKIALDIYSCKGEITLEDADFILVRDTIVNNHSMFAIVKAPIMKIFNAAEEVKKEEPKA